MEPVIEAKVKCPECNTTMKKCKISQFRYAYKALFVDYFCGKCSKPTDEHYPDGTVKFRGEEFYIKCLICDELVYSQHGIKEALKPHVYHIYKEIFDSWKEDFRESRDLIMFSGKKYDTKGDLISEILNSIKYKIHIRFSVKSRSDMQDLQDEYRADMKPNEIWKKAVTIVRPHKHFIWFNLTHKEPICRGTAKKPCDMKICGETRMNPQKIYAAFSESCSALPLTYTDISVYDGKKGGENAATYNCIICHVEYSQPIYDGVIYDHFVECMRNNIHTLRWNIYTEDAFIIH